MISLAQSRKKGAPSFAHFAKGGSENVSTMERPKKPGQQYRFPPLQKNARACPERSRRDGAPEIPSVEWRSKARKGRPPAISASKIGSTQCEFFWSSTIFGFSRVRVPAPQEYFWGGRRDLNPQQPVPQTGALPIELLPPRLKIIAVCEGGGSRVSWVKAW